MIKFTYNIQYSDTRLMAPFSSNDSDLRSQFTQAFELNQPLKYDELKYNYQAYILTNKRGRYYLNIMREVMIRKFIRV